MSDAPHVALLGALHFPVPQGSQVYLAEQGRALVEAGARVTLVCYGGRAADPSQWPFEIVRSPARSAPASHTAGPRARKPLADAALLRALLLAHRTRGFDAVLAHNAEAAAIALLARRRLGVPVLYVAHTLLGAELGVYGPRALARPAFRLGGHLDRAIARRSDAVVALSEPTRAELARYTRAPVVCIPPGLTPAKPPADAELEAVCAAHGLTPGGFAVYAGNLDAYQDVDELAMVARCAPEATLVVATHGPARALPGVRVLELEAAAARALVHAAAVALCPRRRCPGFPIKLLNYMEAGRAILARRGIGGTLRHERDAWLLPPDAGPEAFAAALRALLADDALRARLGAGARDTLARAHAWPDLARRTLELVREATARAIG